MAFRQHQPPAGTRARPAPFPLTVAIAAAGGSVVVESLESRVLFADTFYVSTRGSDADPGTADRPWRHVQKAFDAATPGSTVTVLAGRYNEKPTLHVSGSPAAGYVTFQAQGAVVLTGAGKAGANVITIRDGSYVRVIGFDVRDDLGVSDGSGIRVEGSGDHIELLGNKVHHTRGRNAMGITVYGTSLDGIHDLVIDGNEVYDCRPAPSEALTLNGNVSGFRVTNNFVHDVNNIGIDFIGGEAGMCPDPKLNAARDGVCSGNRVQRARSAYGGGYAAGIYVDGGRDIVVERNAVSLCDLGIEVGCENPASDHATGVASGMSVRDNLVYRNDKAGLAFGGYDAKVGTVSGCVLRNNTLYQNDTLDKGNGEIWIQHASGNRVEDNVVSGLKGRFLVNDDAGAGAANTLDYNLFFDPGGDAAAEFYWGGDTRVGLAAYRAASGQDAHGRFADPLFVDGPGGDLHVLATSPAVDAGDPALTPDPGETGIDGQPRVQGLCVDAGADEAG